MTRTAEDARGITVDLSHSDAAGVQELFGHVSLVEGYNLSTFTGCHALVSLRDQPGKTVAVLTAEFRLQSLLEVGLETGNLIAFFGYKMTSPPTPRGGAWSVDVYETNGVILYNGH